MFSYFNAMAHYFDFSGRATRSQYWPFVICTLVIYFIAAAADWLQNGEPFGQGIFAIIITLIHLIPFYAVQARRFHDLGHTGLLSLLILIPVIGWVVLLGWSLAPSEMGANKYGPDPFDDEGDYAEREPSAISRSSRWDNRAIDIRPLCTSDRVQ